MFIRRFFLLILLIPATISGCTSGGLRLKNLAKSDISVVADLHYRESQRLLRELTEKLYRRNPRELRSASFRSLERRVDSIFAAPGAIRPGELGGVYGTAAVSLALQPDYGGDRIFALMAGLTDMVRRAYNYKSEFFLFSELDEQKLYHSARNLEIAAWQLANRRDAQGTPLVLSNSLPGETRNLSFERLFGKLIANQDMMAVIVARKRDRLITKVAVNAATMVFFPL